jgi:hypothetical protein
MAGGKGAHRAALASPTARIPAHARIPGGQTALAAFRNSKKLLPASDNPVLCRKF